MENLLLKDFNYHLPAEKIAQYPLSERDLSKLLVYKNHEIIHSQFREIADYLPENSLLIFNNSKVFPARLFFKKDTGAIIEIFCLNPISQKTNSDQASQKWLCMVGNAKKWNTDSTLTINNERIELNAQLVEKQEDTFIIDFSWNQPDKSLIDILQTLAELPLPPYMNRKADKEDHIRYQTVYALQEGSVAAPTAGLHFTDRQFEDLKKKSIQQVFMTLHVGAGTFKPIKSEKIIDHKMHSEVFEVTLSALQQLKKQTHIICVGTTSIRVSESIYWLGVKLKAGKKDFSTIDQYEYLNSSYPKISLLESIEIIETYLIQNNLSKIDGSTQIMIMPGYQFKVCVALITNFHQPESTLLLLINAILGDKWKEIYQAALENNYRFLSYGDSSLLFLNQ